jgi:hypothetical protein
MKPVCDEIWSTGGPPSRAIDYNFIVNGGKRGWTEGAPAKQPAVLGVPAKNMYTTNHPRLATKKEYWAKRIETGPAAQAEAAKSTEPSYALVSALTMQRRTQADVLEVGLVRFKHDLKNFGDSPLCVPQVSAKASGRPR